MSYGHCGRFLDLLKSEIEYFTSKEEVRMYSKEDKERILGDWIESGMSMCEFSNLPGKPSRAALREWRKQASRGEIHIPERIIIGSAYNHKKHQRYTQQTIDEAIKLVRAGMKPSHAARRLSISGGGSIIKNWLYRADNPDKVIPKKKREKPMNREAQEKIAELEERLEESLREKDVLREMIRDPKVDDPANLSNAQKAELGERLRWVRGWRLRDVLTYLKISKSSYAYAKKANKKKLARTEMITKRVKLAWETSRKTYGCRRIKAAITLGADGEAPIYVSEHEVRNAMRAIGIKGYKRRSKRSWNSYGGETDIRPSNLPYERAQAGCRASNKLDNTYATHDFTASWPGKLAVTDVTEFKVGGIKVYLSPIIDCFDGMPASWSLSRHPNKELTNASLIGYLTTLPNSYGAVIHSDGGVTYRSDSWKKICKDHGVVRSMSRKGCCGDNAPAEGFFGTLKKEFYYKTDWTQTSYEEFESRLGSYIHWYCNGRLKAFYEDGKTIYDTITGRRKRLGITF